MKKKTHKNIKYKNRDKKITKKPNSTQQQKKGYWLFTRENLECSFYIQHTSIKLHTKVTMTLKIQDTNLTDTYILTQTKI